MKKPMLYRAILISLAFTLPLHAETSTEFMDELRSLETGATADASTVPRGATFYSAAMINEGGIGLLPFPANVGQYPVWHLPGTAIYLMDDLPTSAPAGRHGMRALAANDSSGPPDFGDPGTNGDYPTNSYVFTPPDYGTNTYLEITNYAGGLAYLNLRDGYGSVYAIESSANLTGGWQIETELWPTTTNAWPFTVVAAGRGSLFFRALDWDGMDSDGDGIPDYWAYYWFGQTNVAAGAVDGEGNLIAEDFTNQENPSYINAYLTVADTDTRSMNVPVTVNLVGGVPSFYAVAVDAANYTNHPAWQPYTSPHLNVNVGLTEGWHTVWIGLKGFAGTNSIETWNCKRLKLDVTPPVLVITNPMSSTVAVPVISLQGYAPEALAQIACDVSNAAGVFNNLPVIITRQFLDTNTWAFTTNYFTANLGLTNGLNQLTLRATDLAGNTTTNVYNLTVDYAGKTNPPVLQVSYPLPNVLVCGNNLPVRGWVNDPTVTLTATLTGTNAVTNTVNTLVGREGEFAVDNLPLPSGTNQLTLTATDVAGNVMTTNLTIVAGDAGLTVDAVAAGQTTVTGTITATNCAVMVNGVAAVVTGDTWAAANVPTQPGELVKVTATPAGSTVPSQNTAVVVSDAAGVHVVTYTYQESQDYNGNAHDDSEASWSDGDGGSGIYHNWDSLHNNGTWPALIIWPASRWPQGLPDGVLTGFVDNQHTNTTMRPNLYYTGASTPHLTVAGTSPLTGSSFTENYLAAAVFSTGGAAGSTAERLYEISVTATELLQPIVPDPDAVPWYPDVEPVTVTNLDRIRTPFGKLDEQGHVYALLEDHQDADATATVKGSDAYQTTLTPVVVTLNSLTVVSNPPVSQVNATNWVCVKEPTNDWVYVLANLSTTDTNAGNQIIWSGGESVPGNPFQHRVTKTVSAKTTVTATLGSTNLSLNVWVVWATVEIKTSESNPPNAPSFTNVISDPSLINQLGVVYYDGSNTVSGQVCIIATATPSGIHTIVPSGWNIMQNIMAHEFRDGVKVAEWYFDDWESDFTANYPYETHTLDSNDKLYAIDGPNIATNPSQIWGVDSYEKYNNFYDWVTWGTQSCSSTNNFWHFQARRKSGLTPQINSVDVDTGTISLPTSSVYPPP